MIIGIGNSVLAANSAAGKSDGITTYTHSLLHALKKEFPQQKFLEAGFDLSIPPWRRPFKNYEITTVISVATRHRWSARTLFGRDIDVFHATDHYIPLLDTPVVATIHDALPLVQPQIYGGRLRRLKNEIYKRKGHFADEVITVSQYAAEEINRHIGIPWKKIHVVYEGVAEHIQLEAKQPLDPDAVLHRFGLAPGYIAFCGTLSRKKNLLRLIDAFLSLPAEFKLAHPLVLIGNECGGDMGAETGMRVRQLSDSGMIRWLGRLPDGALAQVIHNASVFVLPSLHEGFGLPVVEAFHLGVPVIASNTAALPEIANGAAMLVDPLDVAAIANTLQEMLTNEGARKEFSTLGHRRAQDFDWSRCAKDTLDVYQKLC